MRQAGRLQPGHATQALPEAGWTKRLGLGLPFATLVLSCFWFDVFGLQTEPCLLQAEEKRCKSLKSALEACPDNVTVTGAESVQGTRMGLYAKTGTMQNDRPVYFDSASSQFLYYWQSRDAWRIGPSHIADFAGVISEDGQGQQCPNLVPAGKWYAWVNGAFTIVTDIVVKKAESGVDAGVAWLAGLPHGTCDGKPAAAGAHGGAGRESPRVGASIALHPPKFYSMGIFLQQFSACPAAMEALSIFVVFSNEQDLRLFEAGMRCRHPGVPRQAWRAVVAVEPENGWQSLDPGPILNQKIAAYKKWHGLLHMMDLGASAPEYGVMLDGELLLYANAGQGPDPAKDCGVGSPWAELLGRIRAREEAKLWPAAVVSATLTTYDFGEVTRSGQDYDRVIIEESSRWVGLSGCGEGVGCQLVRQQISACLYSWWTDLPWVRLRTAEDMLRHVFLSGQGPGEGGWRAAGHKMRFPRFEHIGYQQWCVMHRGFQFRDVTNITGFAKWGSYLEDPVEGSRLGELEPLWVSGHALQRAEEGKIAALAETRPPLLIFHADQGRSRAEREHRREDWKITLRGIMQLRGISHPYARDL